MKLLFVDCCISQRGKESRTRALASAFLDSFCSSHPEAEVETVTADTLLSLKPFDSEMLDARTVLAKTGDFDAPVFDLARQFGTADRIVVAAPFWDMSYPAALRIYIEYISANGINYHYDEMGCHGDCTAERLTYLTSSGDVERDGSVGVMHWRQLCDLFGIPKFDYVFAGGLDLDPARAAEIVAASAESARKLAAED